MHTLKRKRYSVDIVLFVNKTPIERGQTNPNSPIYKSLISFYILLKLGKKQMF